MSMKKMDANGVDELSHYDSERPSRLRFVSDLDLMDLYVSRLEFGARSMLIGGTACAATLSGRMVIPAGERVRLHLRNGARPRQVSVVLEPC